MMGGEHFFQTTHPRLHALRNLVFVFKVGSQLLVFIWRLDGLVVILIPPWIDIRLLDVGSMGEKN